MKQYAKTGIIRTFLLSASIYALFFTVNPVFAENGLDVYFYPPEHQGRMILTVYRNTVSDMSPEWARVLLSGLLYAASSSSSEEMAAVGIKEQDGITRVYSVKRKDLYDFIDEKISINQFVRKMYMAQVRSQ